MKTLMQRATLLALTGLLALVSLPAIAAAPTAAATGQVQETRSGHISVLALGKGSPVVLIPGLSSPRAVWDAFADELAKNHRVLRVQVNGFAGDDPGDNLQPGVLDGIVADLAQYLVDQKLEPAAVVGHSMGGLTGMLLASRHPETVDRLMIVDALPFFAVLSAPPGSDVTVEQVEPNARAMRDAVMANHAAPRDAAGTRAQLRGMSLKPENLDIITAWAMAADLRVVGRALYDHLTTDARPLLTSITAPITVLYAWSAGGYGQQAVETLYRSQYAGAGNARFVDIAESAHFLMLDQPGLFRAALTEFLAAPAAAGSVER